MKPNRRGKNALTIPQKEEIVRLYAEGTLLVKDIAKMFKRSRQTVYEVIREDWKHE